VWIERNEVVRSGATGIFYAEVDRGHTVSKGARLGRVTDFHGRTLEDVLAPFDGEILYIVSTPPVNKGEPLAMLGSR
jgi:predicted deacylase